MKYSIASLFFFIYSFSSAQVTRPSSIRYVQNKKIVEWCQDAPTAEVLLSYLKEEQSPIYQRPFNGIIFQLEIQKEYNTGQSESIFRHDIIPINNINPKKDLFGYLDEIKTAIVRHNNSTAVKKFTDNFLFFTTGYNSQTSPDPLWEDNNFWTSGAVITNAKHIAEAVEKAGCMGIFFDTEPYGFPANYTWTFTPTTTAPNIESMGALLRDRGRRFMEALCSVKPDIKVWMSYAWLGGNSFAWDWTTSQNQIDESAALRFRLLSFFADGLLEGTKKYPMAKVIEEFEGSGILFNTTDWSGGPIKLGNSQGITYVFKNNSGSGPWHGVYNYVSAGGGYIGQYLTLSEKDDLRKLNSKRKQVAQAIYYNGYDSDAGPLACVGPITNNINQKRLEHNVYMALINSDEYVSFYAEKPQNEWYPSIPVAAEHCIISAVHKINTRASLSYTIQGAIYWNCKDSHQQFTNGSFTMMSVSSKKSLHNVIRYKKRIR